MRLFIALLSFVTLAGCQGMSYQEPADGPGASLTFTSDRVSAQPMVCVPGKGFKPTRIALSRHDSDNESLKDLNEAVKKAPRVTINVPAGKPLTIGVKYEKPASMGGVRDRCRVAVRFSPVAGGTYRAHFVRPGDQCGLSVTTDDNAVVDDAVIAPWQCP
jgi:hypothetical protein